MSDGKWKCHLQILIPEIHPIVSGIDNEVDPPLCFNGTKSIMPKENELGICLNFLKLSLKASVCSHARRRGIGGGTRRGRRETRVQ
jgi:hypothetical protein